MSHYLKDSPGPEGEIMTIEFQLDGLILTAIDGGPQFKFNESVSFLVECKDQAEVDSYWNALLAGGGEPGPCGWLKDRFGPSWQVNWVPLIDMLLDADKEKAGRAMRQYSRWASWMLPPCKRRMKESGQGQSSHAHAPERRTFKSYPAPMS
ncbi:MULTISPECIES: VOC family protein [unclassified Mesorhizobium]|nr:MULTISPECIES: VOC family protein [unclassified Mesorhizobium]